jgi:hypothetical protein
MKITPIIASQEIPAVQNIRVPLGAFTGQARGFAALGAGLEQMSEDWYHVARYEQAVEKKQREFNNVTETIKISEKLRYRLSSAHDELERTSPDQYGKVLENYNQQRTLIKNELNREALDAGSDVYNLFQKEQIRIFGDADLKAKTIRDSKWIHKTKSDIIDLKQQIENRAPQVPNPQPMIEFWSAFAGKARDEGIIQPEEFVKMQESLKENVLFNKMKLDALVDPLLAMEKMEKGHYQGLSVEKTIQGQGFAETQLRMKDAARKRDEVEAEKSVKENQKQIRNVLQGMIEANNGAEAISNASYLRDEGFLDFNDVKWVRDEVKGFAESARKVDVPENDVTIRRIHSLVDQNKFGEAKKLAAETDMKPATHSSILNQIRTRQDHLETKATTDQKYRHSQGKGMLSGSLGIIEGQLYEKIEPITAEVYDLAMREFSNRSQALGGKDDPVDLANEIIPKYQDLLLNRQQISAENYQRLLRFKTPQELEAAFRSGRILKGEYESQKEIAFRLMQARGKEEKARRLKANAPKEKAKK